MMWWLIGALLLGSLLLLYVIGLVKLTDHYDHHEKDKEW